MPDLCFLEKVAITGATGFIGSHLTRLLVSAGCRPALLARSQRHDRLLAGLEGRVRWVQCDLTDADSIRDALGREKPRTLFHLAGTRGRGAEPDCATLNFYGTARLLELAQENQVRRIVIAGSAEEYGNQPGPLNEDLSLKPCTEYGISKALATNQALALYARQECPVVIARPFTVYGPGQPAEMFIAQAIESAVRNVPFKMSSGEQKRDLVFVDDVVKGLIGAAIATGVEGRVINLGTGRAHQLRDVAGRVWKMTGTRAPLLIGAIRPAPEELCDTWADISLARTRLRWEPSVDLDDGLRHTITFARMQYRERTQRCQAV
jgi:nucleoside-diphosphate-sugar epimerase